MSPHFQGKDLQCQAETKHTICMQTELSYLEKYPCQVECEYREKHRTKSEAEVLGKIYLEM